MNFQTGKIPAECLLFLGASVQQTAMTNGEIAWELVYKFAERQVDARDQQAKGGWNHFFRSNKPQKVFFYDDDPNDPFESPPYSNDRYPTDAGFFYGCTGDPGFYRLELNPGDADDGDNDCIEQSLNVTTGQLEKIYLKTNYLDQLAIFKQKNLLDLFKPDPLTTTP